MYFGMTKVVFAKHSVMITRYIKYYPVASIAQQIGRPKSFGDVTRIIPVCHF
jgi:hypothetical protein